MKIFFCFGYYNMCFFTSSFCFCFYRKYSWLFEYPYGLYPDILCLFLICGHQLLAFEIYAIHFVYVFCSDFKNLVNVSSSTITFEFCNIFHENIGSFNELKY
eukprot:104131_1